MCTIKLLLLVLLPQVTGLHQWAVATSDNTSIPTDLDQEIMRHGYNVMRHPFLVSPARDRLVHPKEHLRPVEYLLSREEPTERLNEINAEQRLYDLEILVEFASAPTSRDHWQYSSEADARLSGQPVADPARCLQDLQYLAEWLGFNTTTRSSSSSVDLKRLETNLFRRGPQSMALLEYIESFGRPTPEAYLGRSNWLGSYRECMRVKLQHVDSHNRNRKPDSRMMIKTRYCVGKMVAKSWPKNQTITPATTMKVGLCLPESCDTLAYGRHGGLIEKLAKLNFPEYLRARFQMVDMYCLPDERSPLRQFRTSSYVFMGCVAMWLLLVALASLKQLLGGRAPHHNSYEDIFSLGSNLRRFLDIDTRVQQPSQQPSQHPSQHPSEQQKSSRVNLNPIDMIKTIMAVLVMFGHSFCTQGWMVTTSWFNVEAAVYLPNSMSLGLLRSVDAFFVMGGMLATYIILKKFNTNYHMIIRPHVWFIINLQRFIRISPLYMLVYAYEKTIEVYLSKGPWWDYGTNRHTSYRGNCIQSNTWYKMILYLGNFGANPIPDCSGISWYLVADSQIFLIVPIVIYLMRRLGPKRSLYLIVVPVSLVVAARVTLDSADQQVLDWTNMYLYGLMYDFNMFVKFSSTAHTSSLYRIGSVVAGLHAGLCLYMYETGEIKRWPTWMTGAGFKLIVAASIMSNIVQYPLATYMHTTMGHKVDETALLVGGFLGSIVTPMITSIILLRLCTSTSHQPKDAQSEFKVSGHSIWRIISKITYAIYLLHLNVIIYLLTWYQEARPGAQLFIESFKTFSATFFITSLLSLLLYVLYELPMSRLLNRFMSRLMGESPKKAKAN